MKKSGFTLIEVIVSVVLVSVIMVSLLGSLIQIRQTYTLIHENSDVLVYSSSISRVINNDLMNNNGIRYSTCNTEGTKCSIILGNDARRELELFTDEVDLGTNNNIKHDNIKTTLRYIDTTKFEKNDRTNENDKKIVYIRTLELDKYTNEETNQVTANGYNFYDMNTTQYEHSSDEPGNNLIDVFTTINIRLYDGISYDNSRYDVVLYASGRYDYSALVGKAYRIKLDNDGATTAGTTSIDEVFGVGYYESESVHNNSNLIKKITIPTKDGGSSALAFLGYYYVPAGVSVETQIIDASGAIIASSRLFKNNVDLVDATSGLARVYAKWGNCSEGFEIQNGVCVQKQYTVTLNKNGGTGGESSYQVKYQNRVKDLVGVPKKSGYRFVGYNSAVDNTGFHDDKGKGLVLYTYTTNTTLNALYAECSSGTYSNLNNNTCDACISGSITSSSGQGSCVACQNGTTTDGTDRTLCSGNCSNKAHAATWKTVTWNTNNTVTDACQIATCATGYRLNGNSCTAITYKVAYDKNNGSGTDMSNSTHTYDVNKNLSQNTYTRTGYTFKGWAETATGAKKYDDKQSVKNLSSTNNATVTIYAVWEGNTYTATYNNNGGSGCDTKSVTYGSAYGTLCTPTYPGYDFDSWYKESGLSTKITSSTKVNTASNHNLYAKWKAKSYTVTYENNSGSGCDTKSVTFASTYGTLCTPTRTGYTFKGWYKESGLTNQVTASTTVNTSSNHTLYAKWAINKVYIKYHSNGGSWAGSTNSHYTFVDPYAAYDGVTSFSKSYGDSWNLANYNNPDYINFSRTNYYVPAGTEWCTNADGTGTCYNQDAGYPNVGTDGDASHFCDARTASCTITLYINWKVKPVKVYYNVNGGTIDSTTYKTYNNWVSTNGTSEFTHSFNPGRTTDPYNIGTFGLSKTGYQGKSGAQWCTAANGTGTCFDQDGNHSYDTCKEASTDQTSYYALKLYANWVPRTYTVSFNANGGSGGQSANVTATYDANMPTISTTAPTRTGYTFGGWIDSDGTKYYNANGTSARTWNKTSNTTLYAKWTPRTSTVSFDVNGGSGGQSSTVTATYDANMPTISTTAPTRSGYTFGGWYDAKIDGTKYYNANGTSARTWNKTSNATLYAIWTARTYTVSFDVNGGSGGQSANVTATYDANMPTISTTAPTKTGYAFAGWYDAKIDGTKYYNANGTSARTWNKAQNATLYAIWTPRTYTVSFDANGGTGGQSSTVTATYDANMPTISTTAPTKTGYAFAGWYDAKTDGTKYYNADGTSARTWNKTSNATLYAIWTARKYTVSFDADGGSGGQSANVTATYDANMPTISTTAPTKAGYTFGGWIDSNGTKYYNADGTSARTWNKTSNATLYAKWTINKVYVKYHINGGSWGGSTNSHYSFVDPYAAYDGTTSFSKSYGEKLNLANYNNPDYINFTRTNYYVPSGKEWCTKADGTGTCYNQETDYTGVGTDGDASHFCDARTSSCTVILYVNWKVKPVRVYYNRNGGSVTGTGYSLNGNWVSNDGGSSALYEIANPGGTLNLYDFSSFGLTRSGYSRVSGSEWCTKADGTGTCFDQSVNNTYNSLKTPSTDKTSYYELDLYANWTANSYTVTYENNGGSGCTTKTVTYNSTYGTLCTPTKAGYSFGGWYKETGLTNKVESSTKVATASNHKLYAKWIGNEIRIFYHSNWGTLTNSSYILSNGWIANTATDYVRDTVQEGGSLNPYNHDTFKISKTGYHTEDGKEWCTKQDGSGTCYDENGSYSYSTLKSIATDKGSYYEIDVFAHWIGNEIRIFYHANGGTLTNSSYIISNGWIANTATDYVRDTVQEGGSLNPYNHGTFKISKAGYYAEDGKEWCTKQDGSGTCYDEDGSYSYSTLKSIATDKGSYYEIDVFAHWVKDSWTRKTWTCTKGTYSSDTNFYSETCTSISQGDADANNYNYWRTCTSTSTDACRGSTNNVYNCYYVKQYKRDGCETWAEPPTVETGLTTCEESNDFRIYVGCY